MPCERQRERALDMVEAGKRRIRTRVTVLSDGGRGLVTVGQIEGILVLEKRNEEVGNIKRIRIQLVGCWFGDERDTDVLMKTYKRKPRMTAGHESFMSNSFIG